MKMYSWAVWKDCRVVGYVRAYSEWDALRFATSKYGKNIFIERNHYLVGCNT